MFNNEESLFSVIDLMNVENSEAYELYHQMFQNNKAVKLLIEAESGRILDANGAAVKFYGYTREQLLSLKITDINQATSDVVHCDMLEAKTEIQTVFNFKHRLASGEIRDVEVYSGPINIGEKKLLFSIILDVTERIRMQKALRESEQRYRTVVDSICEVIFQVDLDGKWTFLNQAWTRITGYSHEETLGKYFLDFVHPEDHKHCQFIFELIIGEEEANLNIRNTLLRYKTKQGEYCWFELMAQCQRDLQGNVQYVTGVLNDVTERQYANQHIHHLAYYDALTDLPNQRLLMDRLTQALAQAHRENELVGVVFIDLDNFKVVNDTLGHSAGDMLLKEVSQRLNRTVHEGDSVARYGGDVFVVLLTGAAYLEEITALVQDLLAVFSTPFLIEGHENYTSASMGVSVYPHDGHDVHTLIKNADMAVYRAKAVGRNQYQFFTADMNVSLFTRLTLENALARALERNEFLLYYQPQVDIESGIVIGAEALLRWNHPKLGLVPPNQFIPLAEENGLIIPIGEWVLKEACQQAKIWQNAGLTDLQMAVNLSATQFRSPNLLRSIQVALDQSQLDPHYLELELTESMIMTNVESTLDFLAVLKSMHIHLALDDFGTGYSSLNYLKRCPLDLIKIDQSFVYDIVTDSDDQSLVKAIVMIARSLGLEVIAEGVEYPEQLEILKREGCNLIQGYYYSKPVPPSEFLQKVSEIQQQLDSHY